MKVVTFGEIMLRFSSSDGKRLEQCDNLEVSFAGAEANVAVSIANFGLDVEYVTALPSNPLSKRCLAELRGLKVNVDRVIEKEGRLGILYVEKGAMCRPSNVYYDRDYSVINLIEPGEINWSEIFCDASWFHWTGITAALSLNAANILRQAIIKARELGLTISCDLNYRSKLWKYTNDCGSIMSELVSLSDVVLGNEEDCEKYFGIKPEDILLNEKNNRFDSHRYEKVCSKMIESFPNINQMVITLRGSISASHNKWAGILYNGKEFFISKEYELTHIVDRVGGGDSFMGALIYGLLRFGEDYQKTIEFATAASALKHSIVGDYNRVSVNEVTSVMNGASNGRVVR